MPIAGRCWRRSCTARRPSWRRRTACRGGTSTGTAGRTTAGASKPSIRVARRPRAIAPERAIGCVVYCSTELEAPGVIRHGEGTRFSLGEPDRSVSERCLRFSEALVAGGLKAPVEPDLRDEIWIKLLGNAVFNPLSVLTRATLAAMCRHPGTRALAREGMLECLAIANALGAHPRSTIERRHRRSRARRRAPHLDAAGSRGRQAARARRAARRGRRARRAHGYPGADAARARCRQHAARR